MDDDDIPEDFLDPISLKLLDDPVSLPCGHSFNQDSIQTWLSDNDTCPICQRTTSLGDIKPNPVLRTAMQVFLKQRDQLKAQQQLLTSQQHISAPQDPNIHNSLLLEAQRLRNQEEEQILRDEKLARQLMEMDRQHIHPPPSAPPLPSTPSLHCPLSPSHPQPDSKNEKDAATDPRPPFLLPADSQAQNKPQDRKNPDRKRVQKSQSQDNVGILSRIGSWFKGEELRKRPRQYRNPKIDAKLYARLRPNDLTRTFYLSTVKWPSWRLYVGQNRQVRSWPSYLPGATGDNYEIGFRPHGNSGFWLMCPRGLPGHYLYMKRFGSAVYPWYGDPGPQGYWNITSLPNESLVLSTKAWPDWHIRMQGDMSGGVSGAQVIVGSPGSDGQWLLEPVRTIVLHN